MNSFQYGIKLFQIRMNSFQLGMNSLYYRYSHTDNWKSNHETVTGSTTAWTRTRWKVLTVGDEAWDGWCVSADRRGQRQDQRWSLYRPRGVCPQPNATCPCFDTWWRSAASGMENKNPGTRLLPYYVRSDIQQSSLQVYSEENII